MLGQPLFLPTPSLITEQSRYQTLSSSRSQEHLWTRRYWERDCSPIPETFGIQFCPFVLVGRIKWGAERNSINLARGPGSSQAGVIVLCSWQDTLLSQCLSLPRCINELRGRPFDGLASHPAG